MKYNISIPLLKKELKKRKPSKNRGTGIDELFEGTKYLYKIAVIPVFTGRYISIGDIDFDAFDFEDTMELSDFLEQTGIDKLQAFVNFCNNLLSSEPQSIPVSFV